MRQFDAKNCGLDFVKSAVAPFISAYISLLLAVLAQGMSFFANVGSEVAMAPASPYAPKFFAG